MYLKCSARLYSMFELMTYIFFYNTYDSLFSNVELEAYLVS